MLQHLQDAERFYLQGLDLTPSDAVNDLAVTHNQLGNIYGDAGDLDRSLSHWRESVRLKEIANNIFGAATTRRNVAIALAQADRLEDAREYARAALRNFQTFGNRATEDIQETEGLIERIEQLIEKQGG